MFCRYWKTLFGLVTLIALFSTPAVAQDSVAPSSRVTAAVVVRAEPTAQSDALARLRPGETLPLQDAGTPGWYRVTLPDGGTGYVSKAWTDLVSLAAAPSPAVWKVHFVDVGTGLATFVEGPDFALVYDGGSNDDLARGSSNRFLAYLKKVRPDLQVIDHMIVSHPHRDHVELLPDLFDTYQVRNVWESGRPYDICGYRSFLTKVSEEPGVTYHDAHGASGQHRASFAEEKSCYSGAPAALELNFPHGSALSQGVKVPLGSGASMTFLTADPQLHPDPNENSVVVRLDLGGRRLLFMGDAEASSAREPPSVPPRDDFAEGFLVECCAADLKADLLVAGHHGSMSSSRSTFLDAVDARVFVISSGPKRYGTIVLPDAAVFNELEDRGPVWRTDLDDPGCRADTAKIGPDHDNRAGGCDNILVRVPASGDLMMNYERIND